MSGGIAAIAVLAAVIFRLVDQDQAVRVSCRGVRPEIRDSRSAPQAESAAAPVRSDIAALPGSGSGSSPSRFPTVAYLLRAYESPETGEPENCRFQWLSADDCEKYLLYCLTQTAAADSGSAGALHLFGDGGGFRETTEPLYEIGQPDTGQVGKFAGCSGDVFRITCAQHRLTAVARSDVEHGFQVRDQFRRTFQLGLHDFSGLAAERIHSKTGSKAQESGCRGSGGAICALPKRPGIGGHAVDSGNEPAAGKPWDWSCGRGDLFA